MTTTAIQRETLQHIRDCVGGQLFLAQDSDEALILVSGGAIFVDRDGYTAEARGLKWEIGWSC